MKTRDDFQQILMELLTEETSGLPEEYRFYALCYFGEAAVAAGISALALVSRERQDIAQGRVDRICRHYKDLVAQLYEEQTGEKIPERRSDLQDGEREN